MKIHELEPSLPLIQLYWAGTSKSIQRDLDAVSEYAVGIGPYKQDVDAALVEAAHEHCLAVHPYTVNTVEEMQDLSSLGVDGMFTNNPDLLEGVLGGDALSGEAAAQQAADHEECRHAAEDQADQVEDDVRGSHLAHQHQRVGPRAGTPGSWDARGVRFATVVLDGHPVAVRQGHLLATSFHPEVTGEKRVHELFIRMIRGEA